MNVSSPHINQYLEDKLLFLTLILPKRIITLVTYSFSDSIGEKEEDVFILHLCCDWLLYGQTVITQDHTSDSAYFVLSPERVLIANLVHYFFVIISGNRPSR